MGHAENILGILDAQRCRICGKQAARGATVCLVCVTEEDILADVVPQTAGDPTAKHPRKPRPTVSGGRDLRAAGSQTASH